MEMRKLREEGREEDDDEDEEEEQEARKQSTVPTHSTVYCFSSSLTQRFKQGHQ